MTDYAKCPRCSSPVFDNRPDKALGLHPKRPDMKCSSPSCNWAVWLDSGKTSVNRLAASPTPGRADGLPPDCRGCGEPHDWHAIWVWRRMPDEPAAKLTTVERFLVRHRDDRPCGRINAEHKWADGPEPEAPTAPVRSSEDDVKERWRAALRRIAEEQKARNAA